jgi:hypothetical protein
VPGFNGYLRWLLFPLGLTQPSLFARGVDEGRQRFPDLARQPPGFQKSAHGLDARFPSRRPIGLAAGIPVRRLRCDHFATLATLASNSRAVSRQLRPPSTGATTRSRRSRE